MGDDRVMAVLDTRNDALLGLPFELQPCGDGRTAPRAVAALAEDWDHAFPEPEIKKLKGWGHMLGVGLAQLIWEERRNRLVPRLDVWSPRWLSWDWLTRQWFVDVSGEGSDGSISTRVPIVPGDGQWIIYTPSGVSRPWVHGAYRALSRWTLLKQYAIQDWGYYSERNGQGVWVAETQAVQNVGTGTKAQRQELAADLQQLGRNAAIALNPGQTIKLVESVARTYDGFRMQIELADNGTAVSLLGQNLTTQAGTGTMGAASVHRGVLHGRTRVDGKTVPSALRSQAIELWAEYNFGDREVAPNPHWDTASIDDKDAAARVAQMESQADATLVGAGIMTVNEARVRRGLLPVIGGDTLKNTQPLNDAAKAPSTPSSVTNPSQQSVASPAERQDDDAQDDDTEAA